MADISDKLSPSSDGADWAFLALTPILLAATMLAAAAAFAGGEDAAPIALTELQPAELQDTAAADAPSVPLPN